MTLLFGGVDCVEETRGWVEIASGFSVDADWYGCSSLSTKTMTIKLTFVSTTDFKSRY
jgi:hypothetical protein